MSRRAVEEAWAGDVIGVHDRGNLRIGDTLSTEGTVHIGGEDVGAMSDAQLTKLRRRHVGFVFQAFNLVPTLTAERNITLPLQLAI